MYDALKKKKPPQRGGFGLGGEQEICDLNSCSVNALEAFNNGGTAMVHAPGIGLAIDNKT